MRWAHSAHLFSRGPRRGRSRYPVVLRVDADQLEAEPDARATGRGCFKVGSSIPPGSIDILVQFGEPLPRWEPLTEALQRFRHEKDLAQSGLLDLRP